jgi:hypothetical protein
MGWIKPKNHLTLLPFKQLFFQNKNVTLVHYTVVYLDL